MKEYLIHAEQNGVCYSGCRQTEEDAFVGLINAVVNDDNHASVDYTDSGVPVIVSSDIALPDFTLTIREGGADVFVRTYTGLIVSKLCFERIMRFREVK